MEVGAVGEVWHRIGSIVDHLQLTEREVGHRPVILTGGVGPVNEEGTTRSKEVRSEDEEYVGPFEVVHV